MQSENVLLEPWSRYESTSDCPWNLRRVVHLHRRVGFAPTWSEIKRDLAEGVDASVDRLLHPDPRAKGVTSDFERISSLLADAAIASHDAARLKAWWIYRMLFGPDPLGERLVLLWHNHFATSNRKIDDLAIMRQQNDVFRECARAPFSELLNRVIRGPALLLWLDAQANRKEHPNENLARELMELFTLGVGHYTETDVKEAARALTGWGVSTIGLFHNFADRHDEGQKTILSHTGAWRGEDLIRILLAHPATSERLATRVCELFMAEGAIKRELIQSLARGLQEHNLEIGWAVDTVVRSRAFFSEANIRARIVGPIDFVVGSVRALEQCDTPPSTLVLAEWVARLGQDLFYPPNVFGWTGGRSWITTRSIIGRRNFASALVGGALGGSSELLDPFALLKQYKVPNNLRDAVAFYSNLLLGSSPPESLRHQLGELAPTPLSTEPAALHQVIALLVAAPEAQLA